MPNNGHDFPHGNHVIQGKVGDGVVWDDIQLSREEAEAAAASGGENLANVPTSWAPTRKWLAARVTAFVGVAVLFATHGWHFDEHTTIALITVVGESLVSYLTPNE